jgi:Beta-lactamase class C and other penicillin binding proteins
MIKKVLYVTGILSIVLLSFILFFFLINNSTKFGKHAKEVNNRIEQVENGLMGWVQTPAQELKWSIEERMASYKVPGVSVAVINNYQIEWAKGYGWADIEEQRPVTVKTLFQAASISKSLNAVGVLRLAQEGKIEMDEDINKYLTSWQFPYDSLTGGQKISTSNLLSHTAGLSINGFPGYERGVALPSIIEVLDGVPPANTRAVRSRFEPGIRVQYSGGGTTVSQLIVEDITQQPYDKYMQEKVLNPLKMLGSSYSQPPTTDAQLLTTAYTYNGDEVKGKYHIYPEQAAAGLWTNPTDLARYIIELQRSYKGRSNKVLSPKMAQLMLTPYLKDTTAALGLFIEKAGGETYFQHSGSNEGYLCQYYGNLSDGRGVVVMTNSNNSGIVREIINSVATVYNWEGFYNPIIKEPVNGIAFESYIGKYETDRGATYTIVERGGQLFLENNLSWPIYFTSEQEFFISGARGERKFTFDDKGAVTGFTVGNTIANKIE